jgi:hypothetical protein
LKIYLAASHDPNYNPAVGDLKIYLANTYYGNMSSAVERNPNPLRFLTSYYYYEKYDMGTLFGSPQPALLADSGAFSAESQGVSISLTGYADWVKKWDHLFDAYANLDVIGDAEATLVNQRRLEDMGLRPLPVFHVGSPWEYLERYLDEYDYVALGGMVPHAGKTRALFPWLIKAFKMLPEGKGYHGFGTTGWKILSAFPWQSVDSSSWASGYMYGAGILFSKTKGIFRKFQIKDARSCFALKREFANYGYDWRAFAEPTDDPLFGVKSELRHSLCAIAASSYVAAEEWLTERHGQSKVYMAHPLAAGPYGYAGLVEGANA